MLKERLIAYSLANLLLTGAWIVFLHDGALYQLRESPERPLSALFSILLTLLLLGEGFFWLRRRIQECPKWVQGFFYGILLLICFIPFNQLRTELGISWRLPFAFTQFLRSRPLWQLAAVFIVCVTPYFVICIRFAAGLERMTRRVLWVMSPAIVVCIANGIWTVKSSPNFHPRIKVDASDQIRSGSPRVVWLLFDELDQRLIFEKRPKEFQYPEFDRVAKESVSVAEAYSPGPNTIESIPGLLVGKDVQYAQSVFPPDVYLTYEGSRGNSLWSKERTLFSKLGELKVHTALLGWYHAYCTILGKNIDVCERRSHFRYSESVFKNIPDILENALYGKWVISLFRDGAEDLAAEAVELASVPSLDFVFIHLPVPHSPWIYDAKIGHTVLLRSQSPEGYFDNVAYADRILGQIRNRMEEKKIWDKTTLILSTDHSWRSSDQFDGIRDKRIPFFVKMPDAKNIPLKGPFHTRKTGDLVLDVFTKKIMTSGDVAKWLQKASLTKE